MSDNISESNVTAEALGLHSSSTQSAGAGGMASSPVGGSQVGIKPADPIQFVPQQGGGSGVAPFRVKRKADKAAAGGYCYSIFLPPGCLTADGQPIDWSDDDEVAGLTQQTPGKRSSSWYDLESTASSGKDQTVCMGINIVETDTADDKDKESTALELKVTFSLENTGSLKTPPVEASKRQFFLFYKVARIKEDSDQGTSSAPKITIVQSLYGPLNIVLARYV